MDSIKEGYVSGYGYYKCPYCNKTKKTRVACLKSKMTDIILDSSLIITDHICESIDSREFKYMKFDCIGFTPDDPNIELKSSKSKFIISDNDDFYNEEKEGKEEA